jgi:hypothetical protein
MKRKAITQGQGSSSVRPRYVPPQGTLACTGRGQHPAQFAPQGTPQTPHTSQATPTSTRQDLQGRVQAPHASSVVRLGTMLMFVRRGFPAHQSKASNQLLDLAMDSALPGSIKSVLMLPLTELISLLVCFKLIQFMQPYYLILVLCIHLFLLDMPTQMSYHYKICKSH